MYSTNDTKLLKSVHVVSFVEIQTKWIEFRPLMGKWSEFRPAQKNQTRVATVHPKILSKYSLKGDLRC